VEYVTFNEMEINERKKIENILLLSIHPNASSRIEQKILAKELREISQGFLVQGIKYHFHLKCSIHDILARSKWIHIKQHGGYYPCHICYTLGELTSNNTSSSSTLVYPSTNLHYRDKHDYYQSDHGWKGYKDYPPVWTILGKYPHELIPVDIMHNLYEGYFQYLLKLWSKDKNVDIRNIDHLWQNQILPFFTHKRPRSILNNVNQLKAIEVYILFHYFYPLFKDNMPKSYYDHICQFINIIDRLSKAIYRSETFLLDEKLLNCFSVHKRIYGVTNRVP
jgi:hypothetical protein